MQTTFTPDQLKDPAIQRSNEVFAHLCALRILAPQPGPTYAVLGDELDSPRGGFT